MLDRQSSKRALFMTVISVFGPTHWDGEGVFAALQETTYRVCVDDVLLPWRLVLLSEWEAVRDKIFQCGKEWEDMTVEERIAHPLRAFGALCRPVFGNKTLCLMTKRLVYNAVVLTALLGQQEIPPSVKVKVFHNRCFQGITKPQQWMGCISSVQIRGMFTTLKTSLVRPCM